MAVEKKIEAVADSLFPIALQWLELLPTLEEIYSRVLVPDRVWNEVMRGASEAELNALRALSTLQRAQASDQTLVVAKAAAVDEGEAEVIALALEVGIRLVLMDDYRGRKIAQQLGLQTRGVLGHLLILKRVGSIDSVGKFIDILQERGFRLSRSVIGDILRRAGEVE